MKDTLIAVDLAKSVFEVAISHRPGKVASRHRLSRAKFLPFLAQQPAAAVVMESCGSAHHWARRLVELGHRPLLLPAAYVRPYVRRSKTDRSDTKGLLEACRNEEIRPVPVKTIDQQALASLHRLRSQWIASRTARLNTVRGLLRELGLFIPVGAHRVVPQVRLWLTEEDSALPVALREPLRQACEEIQRISEQIRTVERQLRALAASMPQVKRLMTIPGIGLVTATALVALVGQVHRFPSCRHFASYLGLTCREFSSGLRRRLGRISKRGDRYLRMLLVHGARSVVWAAQRRGPRDRLGQRALRLHQRLGFNKAAVAVANQLARIVWAVWKHQNDYQPRPLLTEGS